MAAGYGGQFLMVEAIPSNSRPDDRPPREAIDRVRASIRTFSDAAGGELRKWQARLGDLARTNGRAVVWGAGSKGITFANTGDTDTPEDIVALVDINARKHGMVAPGIALPVVAPADLRRLAPDLVLISNARYQDEIRAMVADLGIAPAFGVIARVAPESGHPKGLKDKHEPF